MQSLQWYCCPWPSRNGAFRAGWLDCDQFRRGGALRQQFNESEFRVILRRCQVALNETRSPRWTDMLLSSMSGIHLDFYTQSIKNLDQIRNPGQLWEIPLVFHNLFSVTVVTAEWDGHTG
jgi:hypothetical protein